MGSPHPALWGVLGHVVHTQSEIQHLQLTFRRCQRRKECLLSVLDQFLTFLKCVYLCCPGWFARALLLAWFSGLIQSQVIKKKKAASPLQPQHLTIPRLCGFPLHVLSAYWAGEGDDGKYHHLVSKSCWVRSLTAASEVLLEIFRTVTTTFLHNFLFPKAFPFP